MYTNTTKLSTTMNEEKWILYQIENLVNHKIYVGVHKLTNTTKSKNYLGSGLALRPAIKKYGRENFTRVTLAEFSCAEDAYAAEISAVTEEFCKREDTYNIKIGGLGCKGLVFTDEYRAKLRAASIGNKYSLGYKHSEESKTKISIAQKGKVRSAETRAKMSASGKGKIISDKQKAQMSAAAKGNKHRLGRTHSEETKAKLREYIDDERKAAMRENCGIAIVIHGKYYPSASFASSDVDASTVTILSRARSEKPKFSDYRFATPEEKAAHALEASRQST